MQNKFTHDNSIPKIGNRIKNNYGEDHFQARYDTISGNNHEKYNTILENTPLSSTSRTTKEMRRMRTLVANSERGASDRNILNLAQPKQTFEHHDFYHDNTHDYTYTDFKTQENKKTPMMEIPSFSADSWDATNKSSDYYNQYHQDKLMEIANNEREMQIAIDQQYKSITQPQALNEIGLNAYQANDVMDPRVLNQYVQQALEDQRQEQLRNLEQQKRHFQSNVDKYPNLPHANVYSNEPPQPLRLQRPEAPLIDGIDPLLNPFEEKQKINKIAHQLKDPSKPIYSLKDATPAKKRVENKLINPNKPKANNYQQAPKQQYQAYDPNYVSKLENEPLFSVSDIVNNWNQELENKKQLSNIPTKQAMENRAFVGQVKNNNAKVDVRNNGTMNQKAPTQVMNVANGVNANNQAAQRPSPMSQQKAPMNRQTTFSNNRNVVSNTTGGNILKQSVGSMAPRIIKPVTQQRTLSSQMPLANKNNVQVQPTNRNILKQPVGSMAPRIIKPVAQQQTLNNQVPMQKRPSNSPQSIFNKPDYNNTKPLLKATNTVNRNVNQPQIKSPLAQANNYNHNNVTKNSNLNSKSMEKSGVGPLFTPYGESKQANSRQVKSVKLSSYATTQTQETKVTRTVSSGPMKLSSYATSQMEESKVARPVNNGPMKLSSYATSQMEESKVARPINNGPIKLSSYATANIKESKVARPVNKGPMKLSSYATANIKESKVARPVNKGPMKLSSYATMQSSGSKQNTMNENSPIVKELAPAPENKK